MAERGGVVGVYMVGFLSPGRVSTAADLVAHIEHALKVCGEDHVGIGSDLSTTPHVVDAAYMKVHREFVAGRQSRGIAAPGEDPEVPMFVTDLNSPRRLELIADTYLSVGTPVQHALPRLLSLGKQVRDQIHRRVQENLDFLKTAISPSSPCNLLDVEGGWYAILQVPRTRSEEQWCLDLLEKDAVLVQPGYFYDFESEAYLVVSLLTPPHNFSAGIRRLLARAETH